MSAKARRRAADQRSLAVQREQLDAAVVLDAVTSDRDVDTLFPGVLPNLLSLALVAYRLRFPKSRVITPWRWDPRGTVRENRRSSFLPKLGDIYCIFCGQLLIGDLERAALPFLRALAKSPPAAQREMGDRVYVHTTPCALQCLAGMREYAAPGTRKLPADMVRGEEEAA